MCVCVCIQQYSGAATKTLASPSPAGNTSLAAAADSVALPDDDDGDDVIEGFGDVFLEKFPDSAHKTIVSTPSGWRIVLDFLLVADCSLFC